MTPWLIRAVPALVLALTGVFLAVAGVLIPIGAAANSGLGSGQISTGFVAIGGALIVLAAALILVAWGVWRAKRLRTHVALAFSIVVIVYLALVAPGAFSSDTSTLDPSTGNLEPRYDTGAQVIVLAIIPYAVALACLIVLELRDRRRAQPR